MSLGSFSRLLSQAASMLVAGRPPRSLHTIRGVGGVVVTAALTGGVGIRIFKKRPDDDDGDVTMEDMKDVDNKPRQEDIKKEVELDIKKDMGKKHQQMDVDVEAKFHKWMEWMGREYPNQEEKAYRFELFKERLKKVEAFTEGKVKNPLPNYFGDMTDDEIRAITNYHRPRSKEYEASMMKGLPLLMKKKEEALMEKAKRNAVNCSKQ